MNLERRAVEGKPAKEPCGGLLTTRFRYCRSMQIVQAALSAQCPVLMELVRLRLLCHLASSFSPLLHWVRREKVTTFLWNGDKKSLFENTHFDR